MIIKKIKRSAAIIAMAASVLTTSPVGAAPAKDTEKAVSKYENKVVANVKSSLNVRKKASTNSRVIGKMKKGNIATIVKKGENWTKIKSGKVRGYVNNDYLVFGNKIENFAQKNVKQVAEVEAKTLRVRAKASTESDVKKLVSEDETYKVKKESKDWVKVKVDGETGYVAKDYVDIDYSFGKAKTLKQLTAKKKAKAVKTIKTANGEVTKTVSNTNSSIGSQVVEYAKQFIGNKYVYGGNSLTNGIDCSGFTQQVLEKFGYSISRTSSSQATEGTAISTDNLQKGDLLFYGDGGGISHVAIYIGDGQIVHASNSAPYPRGGIKISNAFYRTPAAARRIIN